MSTYYCDLDTDFVAHRNGTDSSTNVLTSVAGLQTICNGWDSGSVTQLAAGDIIYIKGTADLSKWVKITVTVNKSATWAIGDSVRNYNDGGGTPGDDWTGTLAYIDATTLWVWLTAGTYSDVSTTDGVDNTTRTDQISGTNMTGATAPGFTFTGNSGNTTSGQIRMIGVNSSYTKDGTTAVFDGKGVTQYGMQNTQGLDESRLEYLEFYNCYDNGFHTGTASEVQFLYCKSHYNGGEGFSVYQGDKVFFHCIARANTTYGFYRGYTDSAFVHCVATDNGTGGIELYYSGVAIHCLVCGNGQHGIYSQGTPGSFIANCTCDDNTLAGISIASSLSSNFVGFCRLTNNGTYGINQSTMQNTIVIDRYNYFYGNATDDVLYKDDAIGSYYHEDTTEDGYVDRENRDYDIKPDSPLCSEKLLLEWDL